MPNVARLSLLLALGLVAIGAAPAGAAPMLRLSSSAPRIGHPLYITASGTTERVTELHTFVEFNGTPCAATPAAEDVRNTASYEDLQSPVPVGRFSYISGYVTTDPGLYTICSYLADYNSNDNPAPTATASLSVRVTGPPVRCRRGFRRLNLSCVRLPTHHHHHHR